MSFGHHRWPAAVRDAFEECSLSVAEVGHHHWQFYLANETTAPIRARIADDWLLLKASCAEGTTPKRRMLWNLLQWNAALSGGARFALGFGEPCIQIRAEIPLIENLDLNVRIRQAYIGIGTAWSRVQSHFDRAVGKEPVDGTEPTGDLARLCQETGWPFVEPSTGPMKIDLETANEFYQATIEQRFCQVHVQVDIAAGESISPPCQKAFSLFLLAVSSHLRVARPTAVEAGGRFVARLEVVFDRLPGVEELCHALSALSIGCRLAGREAAALLEDDALAIEYLSLWRVDRGVRETAPAIGKSNQLTRARIGAAKGESVWVQR